MDYYDGNTVTGLWNLAQKYAMSDNSYTTNFGPSTPGALNVTSAQTYGAICGPTSATINDSTCAAPSGLDTTTATNSGHHRARGAGPRLGHHLLRRRPHLRHLHLRAERGRWRWPGAGVYPDHGRPQHRHRTGLRQHDLGLVRGRLRQRLRPRPWHHPANHRADLRAEAHERRRQLGGRLHPAPRAVPVLRSDRQPDAPAADLGRDDRAPGPGQPPVRHGRLLGRCELGTPTAGVVPEGGCLPGRSRRVLRPAG